MFLRIRAKGIECKTVGVGATPTCSEPPDKKFIEGITEFHPGNYVFYGRLYSTWPDIFSPVAKPAQQFGHAMQI